MNNHTLDIKNKALEYISDSETVIHSCMTEEILGPLTNAFYMIQDCLRSGNLVICCGNGGSAADASHFAAELVCKFEAERIGMRSISLTTDSQIITAIGNDFDYSKIFSRQIESIGSVGDVLVIFSTSGNSENCLLAARIASRKGINVILFTGSGNGIIENEANIIVQIPSRRTSHIQEAHRVLYHLLCLWLESSLDTV